MVIIHSYVKLPEGILDSPTPYNPPPTISRIIISLSFDAKRPYQWWWNHQSIHQGHQQSLRCQDASVGVLGFANPSEASRSLQWRPEQIREPEDLHQTPQSQADSSWSHWHYIYIHLYYIYIYISLYIIIHMLSANTWTYLFPLLPLSRNMCMYMYIYICFYICFF